METLKKLGTYVFGIAAFLVPAIIVGVLIFGISELAPIALPWLFSAAWITFFVSLLILLPMAAFRSTRLVSAFGLLIGSFVFGVTLWLSGFFVSYMYWGFWGVIIGLVLAGVGVVPVALIASLFHGDWKALGILALLIVLTFGCRAIAFAVGNKADEDAMEVKNRALLNE